MLEEFGAIKEELAVSFGTLFALFTPIIKGYIQSVRRNFEKLERRIEKEESERDKRNAAIYAKFDLMTKELHEINTTLKVVEHKVLNGSVK